MNRKMKVILVAVLVALGIFFLSYNQISGFVYEKWLNENQEEILSNITKDTVKENLENISEEDNLFDYSAIDNISSSLAVPDFEARDVKNAIGVISIPSVDLKEPILYGTTNKNLLLGATTMKPEQKMGVGNYTLAGHNHHTRNVLFQPIRNVKDGDEIYVTDKDKVYTYKVIHKEIVMPERVDVLDDVDGKNLITLVSCHAKDGSDRIIVTGELFEVNDYEEGKH